MKTGRKAKFLGVRNFHGKKNERVKLRTSSRGLVVGHRPYRGRAKIQEEKREGKG